MNACGLFQAAVCLVLLLLNFSAATHFQTQPSNNSSTFCFWTKSISNGRTSYMFLHRTPSRSGETSLVLFDSIWTKDNTLVDCVTSSNQVVTKSYVSQCWEPGATIFSRIPDERFNVSKLVDPAGPCEGTVGRLAHPRQSVRRRSRDLESVDRQDGETLSGESSGQKSRRSKRAWIVPGTLWCGAGHSALDFTELGLYVNTDMCCREHDHCKDSITSFGFNYGVLNTNIFTLSHCDCDKKFQQCLHKANDSMANVVGYGYFNVLKMRCFEFAERMECAERTWWGMCKFHQMAKYALVRDATYYNSTSPELEEETSAVYTTSAGQPTATPGSTVPSTLPTEDPRADREHPETTDSQQTKPTDTTPTKPTDTKDTKPTPTKPTEPTPTKPTDLKPTELTPTKPTKSTSTDTKPTDTNSTESTPTKPTDTKPTKSTPTDSKPTDTTDTNPTESTPTKSTQTKTTDSKPTESTPTKPTDSKPTDSKPTDSTPIKPTCSKPTDSKPTESTPTKPTDSKPTDTKPTDSKPTDSKPTELTPTKPTDTKPTESTPTKPTDTKPTESTPTKSTDLKPTDSNPTESTQAKPTQTSSLPKTQPDLQSRDKGKVSTCESYKDLDSCRLQIPGKQEKFGLRNAEFATLYHCNCTARLSNQFSGLDRVDDVHFFLLDFVSQFCFILPPNCTDSDSCSSKDPPVIRRWTKDVAGGRPLVASKRKAKRLNSKRSKRKDSFRLYKKCLRMHSKLQRPKEPTDHKLQNPSGHAEPIKQ